MKKEFRVDPKTKKKQLSLR